MAAKAVKEPKKARQTRSESESSSSAESSSKAEESSSSGSEQSDSSDNESMASSDEESKSQNPQSAQKPLKTRTFGAPRQYKPPFGFKSAKNQPVSSTTTSTLSNLAGKQVFHITAPASLPLSKIKEVSLAGALKGEPILKHGGKNFGIPADSLALAQAGASGQTLFLYDAKAQTYHGAVTNVPTYRIQEMIELPGGAELEEASLKSAKALEKPPRKQPKHLKMRFRPVGSGAAPPETLGSSSEESEGEEPTSKPQAIEKEKEKERKRKHLQTEGDDTQAAGLPRKKSKKHSSGDGEAGEEKSKKSKDRDGKKRKKEKA